TSGASGAPSGGAALPAAQGTAGNSDRYIVVYREQPLATYRGGVAGIAAPARVSARPGVHARVDVRSAGARAYVGYLQEVQRRHEARIASAVGRKLLPRARMQHALNAAVFE